MRNLEPLLTALRAEPSSAVFLHLYPNSGAQSASTLLRAYRATSPLSSNETLPAKAFLFDSTPSVGTYSSALEGMSFSLPRLLLLRLPGLLFIHAFISAIWLYSLLMGRSNVLTNSNNDLNDSRLVPKGAARAYFYSMEDQLVLRVDVEAHAKEAERRGWAVRRERFEGTGHCRHGRGGGEERYWRCVRELVGERDGVTG
jgi:Eukaryotic protein of unknown function (DUF829)